MNKKKGIWAVLFLVIAAFSIWAVIAQCKDFSLENFKECIRKANPAWLVAAVFCMMGFIVFEGLALQSIIKAFGYPKGWHKGFVYSSADIYFSAITPSATGGQPASGYFMMADGIPGAVVTVSLIVNLIMYTAAFLVVGAVCLMIRPRMYLMFHLPGRILIVVGYAILLGLGIMFYLFIKKEKVIFGLADRVMVFLGKIHILHRINKRRRNLVKTMQEYRECTRMIAGHQKMLVQAFLFNLLQRVSQITVTMCVFLATGGAADKALDIWVTQSLVAIGSNCIPVPGAMGVADYLLLDGFSNMMSAHYATNLELLSRSLSFYSCIIISGVTVVAAWLLRNITLKERINRKQ